MFILYHFSFCFVILFYLFIFTCSIVLLTSVCVLVYLMWVLMPTLHTDKYMPLLYHVICLFNTPNPISCQIGLSHVLIYPRTPSLGGRDIISISIICTRNLLWVINTPRCPIFWYPNLQQSGSRGSDNFRHLNGLIYNENPIHDQTQLHICTTQRQTIGLNTVIFVL